MALGSSITYSDSFDNRSQAALEAAALGSGCFVASAYLHEQSVQYSFDSRSQAALEAVALGSGCFVASA